MIIYLAGLQDIPRHLYEAADIDGANRWQKFRFVTVPQMTPILFFNVVTGLIGALQTFTPATFSEKAVPATRCCSTSSTCSRMLSHYFKMGYGSALAWILFIIIMVLTLDHFPHQPLVGPLRTGLEKRRTMATLRGLRSRRTNKPRSGSRSQRQQTASAFAAGNRADLRPDDRAGGGFSLSADLDGLVVGALTGRNRQSRAEPRAAKSGVLTTTSPCFQCFPVLDVSQELGHYDDHPDFCHDDQQFAGGVRLCADARAGAQLFCSSACWRRCFSPAR